MLSWENNICISFIKKLKSNIRIYFYTSNLFILMIMMTINNDFTNNINDRIPNQYHNYVRKCHNDDACGTKTLSRPRGVACNTEIDGVSVHTKNVKNINTYRYNFSDAFMADLLRFSKIHEYDDRKTFKEKWDEWLEENEECVEAETRRLIDLGYQGDVLDKMFKSARYYFRKKSSQKKPPVKRRDYVGLRKTFVEAIDRYITAHIHVKPSYSFYDFCASSMDLLKQEVAELVKYNITDSSEIKHKIKKTYKNRYFLLTRQF